MMLRLFKFRFSGAAGAGAAQKRVHLSAISHYTVLLFSDIPGHINLEIPNWFRLWRGKKKVVSLFV